VEKGKKNDKKSTQQRRREKEKEGYQKFSKGGKGRNVRNGLSNKGGICKNSGGGET